MTYYPVVIPTLNRFDHFKRCVESLAKNTHADKTELVIGLDYPPSEKYREGYEKIKNYIPSISGFKKVTVFEREENYGAVKNAEELVAYVYKKYDAVLFSEDDNVFSPCFLDFMNKGLERYADDDKISSISGYNFPYCQNNNDILRSVVTAWGVGWWLRKDEDNRVYWTRVFHYSVLRSWKKSLKVLFANPLELSMLMSMTNKNVIWGDVARSIDNIVNNRYQLCPSFSMVRNMGHDGSGEHCSSGNNYSCQPIDERKTCELLYPVSDRFNTFKCMMPRNIVKRIVVVSFVLFQYMRFWKNWKNENK